MKIIGITGGVGCGKSEVIRYIIKKYNCFVIFADDLAKQLQEKGNLCYDKIVDLLGKQILDSEGNIEKSKMAEKIFGNKELLEKVNAIIHPAVKDYILAKIEEVKKMDNIDFFIIEAALQIEDGYGKIVDEMWYVYTSDETRRERLKQSRGYSDDKISQIFSKQLSKEQFMEHCSCIIDNNNPMEVTQKQIDGKLEEYLCQR